MKEKKRSSEWIDLDKELQSLPDESQKSRAPKRRPPRQDSAGKGAAAGQGAKRKTDREAQSSVAVKKAKAPAQSGGPKKVRREVEVPGVMKRKARREAEAPGTMKRKARREAEVPEVMKQKARQDAAVQRASRQEAQRQSAGEAKGEKKPEKKRMTNKEFARVTYMFVTLFLVMAGYLVYFNVFRSREVINSPYNIRQDLLAERVIRGDIVDRNGEVLAQTSTAEDGTETRYYPYGDLFSHVVGYAEKGKAGLESDQNFPLLTSNAFFLEKLMKEFQDQKNMGDTVVTTLDVRLQQAAYDALGDNRGAAVVMEASTGKILAMVSKPSFDANQVAANWEALNNDENSALLNRATLGQYAPGSTFKVVTALEYMREHGDYGNYGYECSGEITESGATIHCYGNEAHGWEDLGDSIANSCNASFSNIGLSLDLTAWKKTTKDLLFDRTLPSILPYRESRFRLEAEDGAAETMMTAIGQGRTQVSPYHMALITAAIANGGQLMKPYLVDQITNYRGKTVRKYMPEKYADLMTAGEAAQLKEYMKGVVDRGTGAALSGESYTVAGKTGTAEVSLDKESVHSWFIGFSNVDNPELVVSVVIENADTTSITGVGVAKQIFNAYYYE